MSAPRGPGRPTSLLLSLATPLLLLAIAPVDARAGDDGGVRSVFATGAGNRALGMGGAFAAVADDASAPLYNPAGLGLARRKELQASQTTLFGLGFEEQYAAFVLPSWRWGTAGVTWRRFAVDGIEERDDRGFLLADDLQDSETEIGLGYGRRLADGDLALGIAAKLQHHQLAGLSATGVGVDVGLWSRPLALLGASGSLARCLALGLAVRNAVEPQVRLDQDPVPDPTGLRAGLAWRPAPGATCDPILAVDLERTRGLDPRLHAGAECRLLRVLALRVGHAHDRLTAGAGLIWRGLGADYQFEDHPLDPIHRFGVSLRFGATVAASRAAARAAAEAEVQERLEAAFARRRRDRETELVAAIGTALDGGRWQRALTLVGTLEVLAPARDDLGPLTARAWSGLAAEQQERDALAAAAVSWRRALAADPDHGPARRGLQQVEAASDARAARSREIRERFHAALDAFAREDFPSARDGFAAVLDLSPEDPDAAAMLARTESALTRHAASEADAAVGLARAGRFDAARERLVAAERLDPAAPGLAAAASEVARLREKHALAALQGPGSQPEAAPGARSPGQDAVADPATDAARDPERRRELDDLYRRGLLAMEAGRRAEAVRYWELVWNAAPDHERVRQYLTREYLAQGMESYASGALRQAVSAWEQALRVTPDDDRARGYLQRARQQLARMEKIHTGGRSGAGDSP
jgi:tetratricopeptide (TPR) repeat protein